MDSFSAVPGSFSCALAVEGVAIAAIVLVAAGPAGIAASATGSYGFVRVVEAVAAKGGAELTLCDVVVFKCTGVGDGDGEIFPVVSLICSREICDAGVAVWVSVCKTWDGTGGCGRFSCSFPSVTGEEYCVCASTICSR